MRIAMALFAVLTLLAACAGILAIVTARPLLACACFTLMFGYVLLAVIFKPRG